MTKERVLDLETGEMVEREYVPPEQEPEPEPTRSASIVANVLLKAQDGVLNGIETSCGFSMAFAMGPGSYLLFFDESQPDTAYTCGLSASSGQINPVARDADYIELLATDNGVPTDPAEIHLQVVRVS